MVMQRTLTLEEFLALPEVKPHYEYINGRAVTKPMGTGDHALLIFELAALLHRYREQYGGNGGGEASVLLQARGEQRVLLPDMAFWKAGLPVGRYPVNIPTLAIEVRSPSQPMSELRDKCRFYREAGVEAAWLIDPDSQTAEVFDSTRDAAPFAPGATIDCVALPGLTLDVASLFAVLD